MGGATTWLLFRMLNFNMARRGSPCVIGVAGGVLTSWQSSALTCEDCPRFLFPFLHCPLPPSLSYHRMFVKRGTLPTRDLLLFH